MGQVLQGHGACDSNRGAAVHAAYLCKVFLDYDYVKPLIAFIISALQAYARAADKPVSRIRFCMYEQQRRNEGN